MSSKDQRTKITSAGRKTASASRTGENAILAIGAKRGVQSKCRYKKSSKRKPLTMKGSNPLQDLFSMQPAVIVGLISIMAGSTLQDDIAATAKELRRKGEDVLAGNVTLNF
jgi:hypothetical protein